MPLCLDLGRKIVAYWCDQVEFDPSAAGLAQSVAGNVAARAAAADIVVLQRHAAKGKHQLALPHQLGPTYTVAGHRSLRAENVGQDHRRRTRAVAVDRAHVTAGQIQEAVDLALRVVETPGAGPAVGAAEDRAGAIF